MSLGIFRGFSGFFFFSKRGSLTNEKHLGLSMMKDEWSMTSSQMELHDYCTYNS